MYHSNKQEAGFSRATTTVHQSTSQNMAADMAVDTGLARLVNPTSLTT